MPISFSLETLKTGPRVLALSIPVDASDPSKGWGRIKVRELPRRQWDELWARLRRAELTRIEAQRSDTMGAVTPEQIAQLLHEEREAGRSILVACVVGHEDFETTVSQTEPTDPSYPGLLSALLQAGHTSEGAAQALASGLVATPFVLTEKGAVSDVTLELYDRVSPNRQFVINLLTSICRFHCNDVLEAGDFWRRSGVEEKDIPTPFQKPIITTDKATQPET